MKASKQRWVIHFEQDEEKQIILWIKANKKVWAGFFSSIIAVLLYYLFYW